LVEVEERAMFEKIAISGIKPFVVVGIPAFNEEKSIARVVLEAQKFGDAVIVCDDGSSDYTARIAERLGASVVRHDHNSGYGAALRSLFTHALQLGADVLVTMDADGQHDPSEIPSMVKPIVDKEADVVIGSRFVGSKGKTQMPLYRKFGAKVITKMVNGSSKNGVSDAQSGFRAYNRDAINCLNVSEAGMGASVEILLDASKQDLKILEVPSTCKYNIEGVDTSSENPLAHGMGVATSIVRLIVEEKPLTALGIPGLVFLFTGIFFGVWMLRIYAIEHLIETNIALAAMSFVLISFFMLSTAITLYAISRIAKKTNGKR
jgi:glycosyltransferase involved in cell wall biosynthesis